MRSLRFVLTLLSNLANFKFMFSQSNSSSSHFKSYNVYSGVYPSFFVNIFGTLQF